LCLLCFPLSAFARGSFWSPEVPEQRLAVSPWVSIIPGDFGVITDYSLNPYWSVAWLHQFGHHTISYHARDQPASPDYPGAIYGKEQSWEYTREINAPGFDIFEVRLRFSHQNTRTLRRRKRLECYGAIGVLMYHGFSRRMVIHGKKVPIGETVYEDSNYTLVGELPPFQSLSVGGGLHFYLLGSLFAALGINYPMLHRYPTYRVTSTDPNVSRHDLIQVLNGVRPYGNEGGAGAMIRVELGYAF